MQHYSYKAINQLRTLFYQNEKDQHCWWGCLYNKELLKEKPINNLNLLTMFKDEGIKGTGQDYRESRTVSITK